jgi:DNA-binding CsgD family transcriptional regulator
VRPVVLGQKRPRQAAADAQEAAHRIRERLNTIKTQMRHLYNKLRAHRRVEAVEATRG